MPEPIRPVASELTRPFWEAASRRVLVRPVCDSCERSFFSPQVACPSCVSEAWSYQPSLGTGTVASYTVVHRPPSPAFRVPYVLADVEVDDGWHLLTNVEGCPPEAVHIGMRVRVDWRDLGGGTALPIFRPIGG